MKRKALLIGNSGRPGVDQLKKVKSDIVDFTRFLLKDYGGYWSHHDEIIIMMNPPKKDLLNTISQLQDESYDFAIVVFSGHGGYKRDTILEINENGDTIKESDLAISSRQISIFDCCRTIEHDPIYESKIEKIIAPLDYDKHLFTIRAEYEARIMQAVEQQVSLYACSIKEFAQDGVYIKNLLTASKDIHSKYKYVKTAHAEATVMTSNDTLMRQNPDGCFPMCKQSEQLIIGINPSCLKTFGGKL